MMAILRPSAVHFMSRTTDLLRLLIISSYHMPSTDKNETKKEKKMKNEVKEK